MNAQVFPIPSTVPMRLAPTKVASSVYATPCHAETQIPAAVSVTMIAGITEAGNVLCVEASNTIAASTEKIMALIKLHAHK